MLFQCLGHEEKVRRFSNLWHNSAVNKADIGDMSKYSGQFRSSNQAYFIIYEEKKLLHFVKHDRNQFLLFFCLWY